MVIDTVFWPNIRDQLILSSGTLDLDVVLKDITLHTVIEDDSRSLSVGVYDVFVHKIWPQVRCASDIAPTRPNGRVSDPTRSFFDAAPHTAVFGASIEQDLIHEISVRVKGTSHGPEPPRNMLSSYFARSSDVVSTTKPPRRHTSQQIRSTIGRYGLNRVTKWKLSREFAEKYPFLDCSSGKYPDKQGLRDSLTPLA